VLILVALVLTGIGVWLFQSASFEASDKVATHLRDPLTVRFAVDPYIWSPACPRPLRRRYAIGHVIWAVAVALWAMVAWANDVSLLAVILAVMAMALAGLLIWRSIRHGL
jgi:hypothetical protein